MGLLDSLTGAGQQGGGLLGLSQNDLLSLGAGLLSQPTLGAGAGAAFQNVQGQRRNAITDRLKQQQIDINQGNLDLQTQRFSRPKFSNTPVFGQDAQGNTILGQVNNQGGFQQTQLPEGFTPQRPIQQLDVGTGFVGVPKHGGPGAAGQFTPKDVAGETEQKKLGNVRATRKADLPKARQRLNLVSNNMTRLRNAASKLREHPGLRGITGLRGAAPDIPGGDAANARAKLRTLKAQIGFNALQEMREASKTGGALGQVAVQELEALQNSIDSLETAQSMEEFQLALDNIVANSERSLGNMRQGFNEEFGQGGAQQAPATPAQPQGGITGRTQGGLNFRLLPQ